MSKNLVGWSGLKLVFNGLYFTWKTVMGGIPQESLFRPVLFYTFISDVKEEMENMCLSFAFDTKLGGLQSNT